MLIYKERVEVGIFAFDKINQSKGLIYIYDFIIPDIDGYCSELKEQRNLSDVQKATSMKTKNITSTPLLLTFKEKEPPRFIELPGEQAKINFTEYYKDQ